MDNNTLLLELERINKIENELDRLEALVAFNKTYEKSIFYKKTKLPLLKTLQALTQTKLHTMLEKIDNLLNGKTLIEKITEVIDGIDSEKIDKFFNQFVEAFNPDQLKESEGELKELLNKLQIK